MTQHGTSLEHRQLLEIQIPDFFEFVIISIHISVVLNNFKLFHFGWLRYVLKSRNT